MCQLVPWPGPLISEMKVWSGTSVWPAVPSTASLGLLRPSGATWPLTAAPGGVALGVTCLCSVSEVSEASRLHFRSPWCLGDKPEAGGAASLLPGCAFVQCRVQEPHGKERPLAASFAAPQRQTWALPSGTSNLDGVPGSLWGMLRLETGLVGLHGPAQENSALPGQ